MTHTETLVKVTPSGDLDHTVRVYTKPGRYIEWRFQPRDSREDLILVDSNGDIDLEPGEYDQIRYQAKRAAFGR